MSTNADMSSDLEHVNDRLYENCEYDKGFHYTLCIELDEDSRDLIDCENTQDDGDGICRLAIGVGGKMYNALREYFATRPHNG